MTTNLMQISLLIYQYIFLIHSNLDTDFLVSFLFPKVLSRNPTTYQKITPESAFPFQSNSNPCPLPDKK